MSVVEKEAMLQGRAAMLATKVKVTLLIDGVSKHLIYGFIAKGGRLRKLVLLTIHLILLRVE